MYSSIFPSIPCITIRMFFWGGVNLLWSFSLFKKFFIKVSTKLIQDCVAAEIYFLSELIKASYSTICIAKFKLEFVNFFLKDFPLDPLQWRSCLNCPQQTDYFNWNNCASSYLGYFFVHCSVCQNCRFMQMGVGFGVVWYSDRLNTAPQDA